MADDRIKILAPPKAAHRLGTDLTRRRLLSMGAAGLAGLVVAPGVLAACGGDDSGSSAGGTGGGGSGGGGNHTLNLFTWAEYHSQELLDKFGKVSVTVYNSNEEAIAKLQASGGTSGFDLIMPTGVYIPQMAADNLIQKLDKTRLTNFGNVDPIYLGQTWDPDNQYTMPKDWGSTGWIYDNTVITTPLEDVERLPRRGDGSGERPGVGARHAPATSAVSTSGPTASTGPQLTPRSSTPARTTSSTRSRRTSRLSTRIRASISRRQLRVVEHVERRRASGSSVGRRPRQVHMGPRGADDRALDGQLRAS